MAYVCPVETFPIWIPQDPVAVRFDTVGSAFGRFV